MGFLFFFSLFYYGPHFLTCTVEDGAHNIGKEIKEAEGAIETQALDSGQARGTHVHLQLPVDGYGGSWAQ